MSGQECCHEAAPKSLLAYDATPRCPQLTIPKVLEAVRMLLKKPDTDNALRQWIAELTLAHARSGGQDTRYEEEARRRTEANAARSIDEAMRGWGPLRPGA